MTQAPVRAPRRPAALAARVVRKERLTPHLVRLVLGGGDLARFEPSPHADSYVKLAFCPPGARPRTEDGRVDLAAVREALGPDAVRLRAYTVRAFDAAAAELTLDVVVHGDEGLAGPWAARAAGGEEALVVGPGGAWSPDPAHAAHLLVGDASALPAVAVALERLPADAVGHAVLEVPGPEDRLPLVAPAGVHVTWLGTGTGRPGRALVEAVRALPALPAPLGAFLHGEAEAVRELRRHLRQDRGVAREALSASGYWRLGLDDEGWRAAKRGWVEAVEAEDAA
ncbi:siderophore-interacting protein [Cellulomonas endophytica]|uniref:siderophore-interacting protein n=1 Tax=Cellulomonas endophytica TaxID=2494735 RepID=UPI001010EFA3|nr:siderophore-interacting protein [Cellulomonas endophytica]